MTEDAFEKFKHEMRAKEAEREFAEVTRMREHLTTLLGREPTKDEIVSHWSYEEQAILDIKSGKANATLENFKATVARSKEFVKQFWAERGKKPP